MERACDSPPGRTLVHVLLQKRDRTQNRYYLLKQPPCPGRRAVAGGRRKACAGQAEEWTMVHQGTGWLAMSRGGSREPPEPAPLTSLSGWLLAEERLARNQRRPCVQAGFEERPEPGRDLQQQERPGHRLQAGRQKNCCQNCCQDWQQSASQLPHLPASSSARQLACPLARLPAHAVAVSVSGEAAG